ncbi:helix-turn-helix transcriptional regulator [Laribacter hongkongensis]|uniref:helix-turn-helix transcriptional regulator n=1 Tax=Laribacter hongkongensis TaxID=168471 RepID=UPI001EFD9F37|nr:helix-turn-helix transcriptional regulator [Laribacter hongkongensis]MCG9095504.1 helix-turn-helix transcriptional regulator [Laribacter hongkongensis]
MPAESWADDIPGVMTYRARRPQQLRAVPVAQTTLITVESGIKRVVCGGQGWQVQAGEWLLLPALAQVQIENRPGNGGYLARCLPLDDEWLTALPALTDRLPASGGPAICCLPPDACIQEAWQHWCAGQQRQRPGPVQRQRMLELLLAICLAGGGRGLLRGAAELAPRVNRLLGTDLTLGAAELSRRLAMSESTLRRHLADEGHSLRELREHCRLERALALVQTSSLPIGQVAEACGYASASRFSARFRTRFGCTPRSLRAAR